MHATPRPDRSTQMDAFLAHIGWGEAQRVMLAADASFRHYARVTWGDRRAVLMDAPPPWEDVKPFLAVTEALLACGASVPRILAQDVAQGFLLLEDLGDDSFTRLLREAPAREEALYLAATDALLQLRTASARLAPLPPYDRAVYRREANLFVEWFLPQSLGMEAARALKPAWEAAWEAVFAQVEVQQNCLVHRDYHADNLFWLEARTGAQAVGMLDYQDALWGDAAYDLASLLEDARRDVAPATVAACMAHYLAQTGEAAADFTTRYVVLAAQRNAKIIGIFTRLCVRDGKAHYLTYLPRVWAHFMGDLAHPALAPIAEFIAAHVPPDWRGLFTPDLRIGGMVAA